MAKIKYRKLDLFKSITGAHYLDIEAKLNDPKLSGEKRQEAMEIYTLGLYLMEQLQTGEIRDAQKEYKHLKQDYEARMDILENIDLAELYQDVMN